MPEGRILNARREDTTDSILPSSILLVVVFFVQALIKEFKNVVCAVFLSDGKIRCLAH